MTSHRLSALLGLLLSVCLRTGAHAGEASPVIITNDGPIRGSVAQGVASYLGIPYAKPPVGALRWRAPQPPDAWRDVRNTVQFGPSCYQDPPAPIGPYGPEFLISLPMSEDCLYLNVWTPVGRTEQLPVYVFIPGGAFLSGSGSVPIYDGTNLAAKGVVVVTMNYRLGVFGFLALPELASESDIGSSGNYGLEDVIAALQWVNANIARFGGNPSVVTVGGQSAGAMMVNDLLVSGPAKGLFARAIAESGSGMGLPLMTLSEAEDWGMGFQKAAEVADVAQLRALSAAKLNQVATAYQIARLDELTSGDVAAARVLPFAPNIDGRFLGADPEGDTDPQSNVPLLTGFNSNEASGAVGATPEEFIATVRTRYGAFADRFLALYPHATAQEATASMAAMIRDRYMARLMFFSEDRARASGEIVYDYLFDHAYPGSDPEKFGAFHTAEVPYVFGALQQSGRVFTAADHDVSRQLQTYWIHFMKTGDPNDGDFSYWPKAGNSAALIMGLGDHPGARLAVSSPARLALFREYAARADAHAVHALRRRDGS
ncbi:MAG: carboxylesterase family protein [Gammaproteobacteria bacterium]|nr:carboxylesterase family protein [Gammaproteobacteria bacterium]